MHVLTLMQTALRRALAAQTAAEDAIDRRAKRMGGSLDGKPPRHARSDTRRPFRIHSLSCARAVYLPPSTLWVDAKAATVTLGRTTRTLREWMKKAD